VSGLGLGFRGFQMRWGLGEAEDDSSVLGRTESVAVCSDRESEAGKRSVENGNEEYMRSEI
jgi:hypothetical protein